MVTYTVIHTADAIRFQPRSLMALALLVLAAIPWFMLVGWFPALLAALFAWLARINQGSRPYAIFSSVYAALAVVLLPPFDFPNNLFNRLEPFFMVLVLGYGLGMALDGVQDSTIWAWLAPLLLLLFAPSVFGMVALFGLAILAALEKQQRFIGINPYQLQRLHLVWLAAGTVFIASLGLILPVPSAFQDPTGGTPIQAAQPAQPRELPKMPIEATSGQPIKVPNTSRIDQTQDSLLMASTAVLYFFVVLLAFFLFNRQLEQGKKTKNSLWDLMPIIAFFILATAFFALALNAPNGGSNPSIGTDTPFSSQGGQPGIAAPEEATTQAPPIVTAQRTWIPFGLAAIALLFAYLLFRRLGKQYRLEPDKEPDNVLFSSIPSQSATNRVRVAYQTFLEYAQAQGIPRTQAETPLEFARRYAEKNPETQEAVTTLTHLYEPVRYGQLADETHALKAEIAAQVVGVLRKENL